MWVAPIEAVRGLGFDVVLVPGLAERVFPRKIVEDPLLLDVERRKLDAGLPLQGDRVAEERLALRLAAGAAREKVVFSYPSIDLQKGRSKVPSFYLLEVVRASEGSLPDFESLEREASDSSGARLGWPAPRDPARAIDETEHDLAFLSDALRQDTPKEKAQGTGRYLINVNAALARSLRTRYQRGRSSYTAVDGFLDPSSDSKRILSGHRFGARAFSVTALEKFGACPYRFFLNAVLRLRPRETVEQITHLNPLTYGRIMHVAQYEILKKLQEEKLTPVRPDNLATALRVGEEIFNRIAEEFRELLAPAIERIWRDELARVRTDLRGWLRRESEAPGGWVPHGYEFTFGMKPQGPADPSSVLDEAVLASGLRLRGAIDLVEKRADGKVRVTDYKSGRVRVPQARSFSEGKASSLSSIRSLTKRSLETRLSRPDSTIAPNDRATRRDWWSRTRKPWRWFPSSSAAWTTRSRRASSPRRHGSDASIAIIFPFVARPPRSMPNARKVIPACLCSIGCGT